MKRWIVVLLVFGLFGAGCKSSSTIDVASNPAETVVPTTTAADPSPAADDAATPNASALLNSDDWCTVARQVATQFDELDIVGYSDPVALEKAYTEALEIVKSAQFIAPSEIADDVKTTVRGLEAFTDALDAVDWSFLDLDLSVLDELSGELAIASFNIEKYNFDECGIDNGFDPADDPALNTDTPTPSFSTDGTVREQVINSLVASGFTRDEATCIAGEIDITNPDSFTDASSLLGVFSDCGISLDRLGRLGG